MLKTILPQLILMAFSLCLTVDATALPRQKWCGTDAKNIFGYITSKVPEYSPSANNSSACPGRRANLWKSCRAHDECEWYLGKPLKQCHDEFLNNLKWQCQKTFVRVPTKLKEGCAPLADSCYQTAYIYYAFMLKGDLLTNSGNLARGEAREVYKTLKRKMGTAKTRKYRSFIFNRISFYCPRYKDQNNDCRINYVAERVISDLIAK